MKFMFPSLSSPIIIEEYSIYSLVIENQKLLRHLLEDLYNQQAGYEGTSILSNNDVPIDISKNVELISNYIPFDINQKRFLNRIINTLEEMSLKNTFYHETQEILNLLERHLSNMSFNLNVDIDTSKLFFPNILKAIGIYIKDDYEFPLEKLLNFFEMVLELEKEKLFITINLRSFYTDEELYPFIETLIDNKYKLLMIESSDRPLLMHEKRLIIDNDLCEL